MNLISAYLNPNERERAYVTDRGGGISFINTGDMYRMAARYLSWITDGAVVFNEEPPPREWDADRELKRAQESARWNQNRCR